MRGHEVAHLCGAHAGGDAGDVHDARAGLCGVELRGVAGGWVRHAAGGCHVVTGSGEAETSGREAGVDAGDGEEQAGVWVMNNGYCAEGICVVCVRVAGRRYRQRLNSVSAVAECSLPINTRARFIITSFVRLPLHPLGSALQLVHSFWSSSSLPATFYFSHASHTLPLPRRAPPRPRQARAPRRRRPRRPPRPQCVPPLLARRRSPAADFAHVLEQLETQFYTAALAKFAASDFQAAGFSSAQIPAEQFQSVARPCPALPR